MYNIGDTILYAAQGVCKIQEMMQRDFNGTIMEYYVLKPVFSDNSTIYVPVNNPALVGKMRRILSKEEIEQIIRDMPEEELLWFDDEAERKEKFREVLFRADTRELVRMIKALYLHQQKQQEKGKHLHAADERVFKEAEKILYDEFALVLQIRPEQVVPFITEKMQIQAKSLEQAGA